MYKLEGILRDTSIKQKRDSFMGYPIVTKYGKIKKKNKNIIDFVLKDTSLYIENYAPARQPFAPNYAIEYLSKKKTISFLFSFGSGEIAVREDKESYKFFHMRDSKAIRRVIEYTKEKK